MSEGYIVEVVDACAWLAIDGTVTCDWDKRGVWRTEREAEQALKDSMTPNLRKEEK